MYKEHFGSYPDESTSVVGSAIDQVVSSIPLKAFRKQGLSEVRVVSEKTLNEIVQKAVEDGLEKRSEALSKERDELRIKSENLSEQLEALKEGSGGPPGEKERLEKKCVALEDEMTRLRSEVDARKIAFQGGTRAQTSITSEKYEEKIKQVVEDILEGARGTIPIDLFENIKESLPTQLIEKFPHNTYPLRVVSKSETTPTSHPQPTVSASGAAQSQPKTPASRPGAIKSGSLFHKLVESNIKWRHKQKAEEEGQKE
ncbi:MAG: hypothetical protein J3T61_01865 [Candidatus Brocadiales bacterium]|nr:hypothetical protein [Candidatus Bathyanammoxibius sp.]